MLNVYKYEYDWCCEGDYKMTKYEKQYPRSTLWEPEQMPYSCNGRLYCHEISQEVYIDKPW